MYFLSKEQGSNAGYRHRVWLGRILVVLIAVLLNGCFGSYYSASNLEDEASRFAKQGDQHFHNKEWAEAEKNYSKAISKYKDFYSECKFAADCRVKTGNFKHTMSMLAARRGMSRLYMKDKRGAESDASLSIDYDPFEPGGHTLMGLVYLDYKEIENAKKEYQKLLDISKNTAVSADARRRAKLGADGLGYLIWGKK